jgi:hypothetical protein
MHVLHSPQTFDKYFVDWHEETCVGALYIIVGSYGDDKRG